MLESEEKLVPDERPNPAFKTVFPTSGSTYWLDQKGRREPFTEAPGILQVTDREGKAKAERGLPFDTYRADVNADGSAIIFLSREGILHGYTDHLEPFVTQRLYEVPEYKAQCDRLGIEPRELKNHTRCVAISADRSWYLVTVVDEAWCLSSATGDVRWGLRFPAQEGWTRVATPRSELVGSSGEIGSALQLMELRLPVTPQDITRQYRALAMRWHPDRNPGDPSATARFQSLQAAMELLTGADVTGLSFQDVDEVTYERILHRERLDVSGEHSFTITSSMITSEKHAADWIYAADAAVSGDQAFLAAYSGKIVEVTGQGIPRRVIDIGAVPRQVLQTQSHLYILTDTRLYVLAGDRLEALVDVFDAGTLITGQTGFGLLQQKAFSWHSPAGDLLGSVHSRDPVRRVVSSLSGLIVETRQHRAIVRGAQAWWQI